MRHWRPFQTVLSETGLKDQSSSPKPAPELRPVAGIVPAGCRESPPHYTYTYSGFAQTSSLREGRPGTEPRLKVPPLAPPRTPGPAFTGLPVAQAQKLLCVEAAARRAGWVGAQALGSLQFLCLRCVFAWAAGLPSRWTSLGKEVSRVPSRPHSQGRRAATGPSPGGCGKSRGRGRSQAKFGLLADAGSLVPSHSTLLTWSASVAWGREPNYGFLATPNIRLGSILPESTSGSRTSASHFTCQMRMMIVMIRVVGRRFLSVLSPGI